MNFSMTRQEMGDIFNTGVQVLFWITGEIFKITNISEKNNENILNN
jgi:ABC-type polysaccharide/polyol phosphate export permease